MITRRECEDLLSISVQSPGADEIFASLSGSESLGRSVAGRVLHPPHHMRNIALSITVRKGKRYAMASGNVFGERDVRDLVARAAEHAALMPEVPEVVPFPGRQDIPQSPIFIESEDSAPGGGLDDAMRDMHTNVQVFGTVNSGTSVLALASSNGLFAYQPSSHAHAQFRCYTADGGSTAFDEQYALDRSALRVQEPLHRAVETCLASRNPVEIKPGRITTIFDPRALADMLRPMLQQFSRRAIEQDQSFLRRLDGSSFLGTTLFDTRVTLRSDPFDPVLPSMPFTAEGQAVRAAHWVKSGVIAHLVADRYDEASKEYAGKESDFAAPPSNLLMDVAEPVPDLVAGTEYGLLVRGFANLNILDSKNCLLSGSTRDGVFLIEKGKVTKPVRNLVIRETPVYLFKELLAMGAPVATSTTGGYFPMYLPSIKVKDVMYTQLSGLI